MAMSIKQQQWQLLYLGYYNGFADNIWGKGCEKGMLNFQREYNLTQTGKPNELFADKSKKIVRKIQELLKNNGYKIIVDGLAGTSTRSATKDWQRKNGLVPDGIAGVNTRNKMFNGQTIIPASPKPRPIPTKPSVPQGWESVKYFTRQEFACKCREQGHPYCNGFPVEPSLKLAHILDQIREHFGQPITITSGIRCPRHNARVGGASRSKHMEGIAADIQVRGVNPAVVANYVETLMPNWGGIGRYRSFTHVDVRDIKGRWYG